MVLPPEMIMATIRGDLGALQTFLDQHPERVDDVADEADPMAHRTMSQIAIMCLAGAKWSRHGRRRHTSPGSFRGACRTRSRGACSRSGTPATD